MGQRAASAAPPEAPAQRMPMHSAGGVAQAVVQCVTDWQPGSDCTDEEKDQILGVDPAADAGTAPAGAESPRDDSGFLDEVLDEEEAVTIEGDDHHLRVELHGGRLQLVVASDPKVLFAFLASPEGRRLSNAAKKTLKLVAAQLGDIYSDWKGNLGRALKRILDNIAQLLSNASKGAITLPESVVRWPSKVTTRLGRGSSTADYDAGTDMIADPLSIKGPQGIHGQQPASEGIGSGLIWGHLLNHKLHGPNEHRNLMPISTGLNGAMESQVEDVVKKAVLGQNKVVRYRVEMRDLDTATSVSRYATAVRFELQELESTGGGWVAKAAQPAEFGAVHGQTIQAMADPHAELEDRRPIKLGDEQHTLMIELSDGVPRLMVASDPELLDEFLEGAQGQALDKTTFGKIDALARQYDQVISGYKNELGLVVKHYLGAAAAAIRSSTSHPIPLPATSVAWTTQGSTLGVVGKTMRAAPLSLRPGDTAGSEPSQETIRAGFVWGHLLNHKLHGPAELRNLAPITASFNQRMERTVETAAKNAVLGQGKVIRYEMAVADSAAIDEIDYVPTRFSVTLKEQYPRKDLSGTVHWVDRPSKNQPAELSAWDGAELVDKSQLMEDLEEYVD